MNYPLSIPSKTTLQQLCKAISVLDAILSPEWQYRYFSYQSQWSESEEFFEMRNGEGDHVLILFNEQGCVINGMAHEYHSKEKEKLTSSLPQVFHEFVYGEPANSIGTTFCFWKLTEGDWQTGIVEDPNDGSIEMLWWMDNNPSTYANWAAEYYDAEDLLNQEALEAIKNVYAGNTLTREMVNSVAGEFEDWEQLTTDLQEINYPFDWK